MHVPECGLSGYLDFNELCQMPRNGLYGVEFPTALSVPSTDGKITVPQQLSNCIYKDYKFHSFSEIHRYLNGASHFIVTFD